MPRQSVADLLGEVDQAPPAAPPAVPPKPEGEAAAAAPLPLTSPSRSRESVQHRREHGRRRDRRPATTEVTESQAPKWQRLERKELRLRADQLDELARLRRALNRQRGGEGERITENTLIRVAVDMLLGRADRLRGITEDELRKSVTS
jgi:hypothetical protein